MWCTQTTGEVFVVAEAFFFRVFDAKLVLKYVNMQLRLVTGSSRLWPPLFCGRFPHDRNKAGASRALHISCWRRGTAPGGGQQGTIQGKQLSGETMRAVCHRQGEGGFLVQRQVFLLFAAITPLVYSVKLRSERFSLIAALSVVAESNGEAASVSGRAGGGRRKKGLWGEKTNKAKGGRE